MRYISILRGTNLLRWGVIFCVLGASAVLGALAENRLALVAGAAVGGMVVFLVLVRWLEVGVLLLLPISFLLPWGVGTGTETEINLTILWLFMLLGVWLVRMIVNNKHISLRGSIINLPGLLFVITTIVAMAAGNVRWLKFSTSQASIFSQIGGTLMLVLPVGLLLMVGNIVKEENWLRKLVLVFLGLGTVHLIARWVPGGGIIAEVYNEKSVSALFYIWVTALSGGIWLFDDTLKRWQKYLVGGLFGLTVVTALILMSQNASTWFSVLVVIGMLIWLKSWRMGLVVSLALGVAGIWHSEVIIERVFRIEEYSAITRAATWPIMWELVKASPIIGLGPSNYYFYTPLFSLMGYYIQFNSHNNYWDIAAQVGLLGLVIFLWLSIALGWTGIRLRQQVRSGFRRAYTNAALAGLVGTLAVGMLGDWFMPFVYNIGFNGFRGAIFPWIFLGGLLALEHLVKRENAG